MMIDRENRRLHSNLAKIYSQDAKDTIVAEMGLATNDRIAAGLDEEQPSQLKRGAAIR
eukprot:SAG11_NODE_3396_length_2471_cov_6.897555_2_plen_58_part_00